MVTLFLARRNISIGLLFFRASMTRAEAKREFKIMKRKGHVASMFATAAFIGFVVLIVFQAGYMCVPNDSYCIEKSKPYSIISAAVLRS